MKPNKPDPAVRQPLRPRAGDQPKVVAEMPADKEIQENLEETKQNDGFPGSCGI